MTAPIPTTEAVDALAGAMYAAVSKEGGGLRDLDNAPVARADVPTRLKFHQRAMALDVLMAAYPQIVADVLDHYADAAFGDVHLWGSQRDVSTWLRAQADEVRP